MMAPDRFIGCVRTTIAEAQQMFYENSATAIMAVIAGAAVAALLLRKKSETL
jgi:hypothetical protein